MAAGRNQITDKVNKAHPCQVAEFGCNGATPQTVVTLPTAAVDLATTEALVNAIAAALKANGICQ